MRFLVAAFLEFRCFCCHLTWFWLWEDFAYLICMKGNLLEAILPKQANIKYAEILYLFYWQWCVCVCVLSTFQLLVALFRPFLSWPSPLVTALLIGVSYQFLLSGAGLRDYLVFGPNGDYSRPTLFSANREGIISCLGYLSLYYGGMQMGKFLFRVEPWVSLFDCLQICEGWLSRERNSVYVCVCV